MANSFPAELCVPTVISAEARPTLRVNTRTRALVALVRSVLGYTPRKVLVVGCGSGEEAAALAIGLTADVTGVDIKEDFDPVAACHATLMRADATRLPFATHSFDFVYSHHALEHIGAPVLALSEMKRVLRPGMSYFVGTPNRSRIVAYINAPGTPISTRIKWNIIDWRARLQGRFRNEYGAHAGFTAPELAAMLERAFGGEPHDLSEAYYRRLYTRNQGLLRAVSATRLSSIVFPSVYFIGESRA